MKRSMISNTSSQSPNRKITITITKTKSLREHNTNQAFYQQNQKIQSSIISDNKVTSNEQIQQIKMFVQEIATDPSLLHRLIDYNELIQSVKEEQLQIKQKIQQQKKQFQRLTLRIEQARKQSELSPIYLVKQQQNLTNQQIKKYLLLITDEKERKRQKNQEKILVHKKLLQQISASKPNSKIQLDKNNSKLKDIEDEKIQLNKKIFHTQKLTNQLKKKFAILETKNVTNQNIKSEIVKSNELFTNLKKQEKQQLTKYKNGIMQKKTFQFQYKKSSQKKLSKFIEQLSRHLQKVDRQGLNNIKLIYQNKKTINRASNLSADTKPDENEDSWQEQQSTETKMLQNMQVANPVLKKYRNLDIKTLLSFDIKQKNGFQKQEQIKQIDKNVNLAEQKLRKLIQQQIELDTFIISLKDKLDKMAKQLNDAKNYISK